MTSSATTMRSVMRRATTLLTYAALGAAIGAPAPLRAQASDSARADSARRAAGPPGTDIWVATLSVRHDTVVIGRPENVTHRLGYDNQPAFTPDGRSVLYTSIGADGQ